MRRVRSGRALSAGASVPWSWSASPSPCGCGHQDEHPGEVPDLILLGFCGGFLRQAPSTVSAMSSLSPLSGFQSRLGLSGDLTTPQSHPGSPDALSLRKSQGFEELCAWNPGQRLHFLLSHSCLWDSPGCGGFSGSGGVKPISFPTASPIQSLALSLSRERILR